MRYVVKWRLTGESRTLQSPAAFALPGAAIDFACTVFKQHPVEIWSKGRAASALNAMSFSDSAGNADRLELSPACEVVPGHSGEGRATNHVDASGRQEVSYRSPSGGDRKACLSSSPSCDGRHGFGSNGPYPAPWSSGTAL
jgi:hypothetical protein